jgi:uncharacterized protein (DUF433 family)
MSQFQAKTYGGEPYQCLPFGSYVVRAPGVCGGQPTFKYTRIEIAGVLQRLAAGETVESLVNGYNGRVSAEAILEAGMIVTRGFLDAPPELAEI